MFTITPSTRVPATRIPATPIPPTATPIPPTPEPAQIWTATPQAVALDISEPTRQPRRNVPQMDARAGEDKNSEPGAWIDSNTFSLAMILGVSAVGIGGLVGILLGAFLLRRMLQRGVDEALDPSGAQEASQLPK